MTDTLEQVYKNFGENICLFPFLSVLLVTWATDKKTFSIAPCTVGSESELQNAGINDAGSSIIDSYNKQEFLNFRQAHFDGKGLDHPYCKTCKNNESNNAMSARKSNNRHLVDLVGPRVLDILQRIKQNENRIHIDDIVTSEYMPSNYCNFACLMCFPGASSKRREHLRKMGLNQPTRMLENNDPSDLADVLSSSQLINFTGGETMLQPQVLKTIDQLIEADKAKDIVITFLTNLSKYDNELLTKLEKFKNCTIIFSVDGTKEIIEYQRIGAVWNDISNNLLTIKNNHPKLGYVINYVVTAISVFDMPNIIRWCKENHVAHGDPTTDQRFLTFSPVFISKYLDINALPANLITKILDELFLLKEEANIDKSWQGFTIMIEDAINYLSTHTHDPTLTIRLKSQLEKEDLVRTDGLTYKTILGNALDEY